jgi:hypothetical protein
MINPMAHLVAARRSLLLAGVRRLVLRITLVWLGRKAMQVSGAKAVWTGLDFTFPSNFVKTTITDSSHFLGRLSMQTARCERLARTAPVLD